MSEKVAKFYDEFADLQLQIGVNSRHLSIVKKVLDAGLKPDHRVLEVGCGIGTVSHLLAKKVPKGSVLAVDISPESIRQAALLWASFSNLRFETSDMKDFDKKGQTFDTVVFPDVLEHIPVEDHAPLFEKIKRHSHQDTMVFIHIPAPRFLEWMIANEAEKLQVIDQPLDTAKLVGDLAANGFYLDKMETYSVFYEEKDYQYFVFKRQRPIEKVTHKPKWQILKERLWNKLGLPN
ncbi:MAG: methyltransferase domain-containing protein [Lunatimonas sp.]|uniref:class I SAM-dependent methyltransferase n=1 Tax=Lunatimonas sp. TaxID=2060141 RepID=UPI00263A49EF|nr:class I SAM-dependent methyltransferase [Lunatimonas sp.]MCC5938714.1 methyltransferase domain-containing protein [Lunatimonas sp.]